MFSSEFEMNIKNKENNQVMNELCLMVIKNIKTKMNDLNFTQLSVLS